MLEKYRFLRGNIRYELFFKAPMLDLSNIGSGFFRMVFELLPKADVKVNVGEFSIRNSSIFSENQARYSIYGGNSSVSMQADRLIFDFPGVVEADLPIMWGVIKAIHDAFPSVFPDLDYDRLESNSGSHLLLPDVAAVDRLLARFAIADIDKVFGEGNAIMRPTGKIDLVAVDQSWSYSTTLERSLLQPNALFVYTASTFRGLSATTSFQSKIEATLGITLKCLNIIGIEPDAP